MKMINNLLNKNQDLPIIKICVIAVAGYLLFAIVAPLIIYYIGDKEKKKKSLRENFRCAFQQVKMNFSDINKILSEIAIFLGIFITLGTYYLQKKASENLEKRKYAIEAIDKIYNSEFLEKYRLVLMYNDLDDKIEKEVVVISADTKIVNFNFVLNTCYIVSLIYNDNIGDKSIISKSLEQNITNFAKCTVYKDTKRKSDKNTIVEIEKMIQSINIDRINDKVFKEKHLTIIKCDSLVNEEQRRDYKIVFESYYSISVIYNNEIGDKSKITKDILQSITDFISSKVYDNQKIMLSMESAKELKDMNESEKIIEYEKRLELENMNNLENMIQSINKNE